jgi:hypothetical protein
MSALEDIVGAVKQRLEIKVASYRELTAQIRRYQLVFTLFLAVLLILTSNYDFSPSRWASAHKLQVEWLDNFKPTREDRDLSYGIIVNYGTTEKIRAPLTKEIEATGLADSIPESLRVADISKFLADRYYGIDFLDLPEQEHLLALMQEQEGAKVLSDLSRFNYQGGPNPSTGTSLRDAFFADYGLGKHKVLMACCSYVPDQPIAEYVNKFKAEVARKKDEHKSAYIAWSAWNDEFLEKYRLSEWEWGPWRHVSDKMVNEWHTVLSSTVGPIDDATQRKLVGSAEKYPDWGSVINHLSAEIAGGGGVEAERKAESKVNVWSIDLVLPLRGVLVLFPMFFVWGTCILCALIIQRSILSIEIEKLDTFLGDLLGVDMGRSIGIGPSDIDPAWSFSRIWGRVRQGNLRSLLPYAIDATYAAGAWSLALATMSIGLYTASKGQLVPALGLPLLGISMVVAGVIGWLFRKATCNLIAEAQSRSIGVVRDADEPAQDSRLG